MCEPMKPAPPVTRMRRGVTMASAPQVGGRAPDALGLPLRHAGQVGDRERGERTAGEQPDPALAQPAQAGGHCRPGGKRERGRRDDEELGGRPPPRDASAVLVSRRLQPVEPVEARGGEGGEHDRDTGSRPGQRPRTPATHGDREGDRRQRGDAVAQLQRRAERDARGEREEGDPAARRRGAGKREKRDPDRAHAGVERVERRGHPDRGGWVALDMRRVARQRVGERPQEVGRGRDERDGAELLVARGERCRERRPTVGRRERDGPPRRCRPARRQQPAPAHARRERRRPGDPRGRKRERRKDTRRQAQVEAADEWRRPDVDERIGGVEPGAERVAGHDEQHPAGDAEHRGPGELEARTRRA